MSPVCYTRDVVRKDKEDADTVREFDEIRISGSMTLLKEMVQRITVPGDQVLKLYILYYVSLSN